MHPAGETLMNDNDRPREENVRLKAQVQILMDLLRQVYAGPLPPIEEPEDKNLEQFKKLTPKQHAALQMLLRGAQNKEIADRLDISENTAKVHLRGIMKKLDAKNRTEAVLVAKPIFDRLSADEYEQITKLPHTWDEDYDPNQPINEILKRRGD